MIGSRSCSVARLIPNGHPLDDRQHAERQRLRLLDGELLAALPAEDVDLLVAGERRDRLVEDARAEFAERHLLVLDLAADRVIQAHHYLGERDRAPLRRALWQHELW